MKVPFKRQKGYEGAGESMPAEAGTGQCRRDIRKLPLPGISRIREGHLPWRRASEKAAKKKTGGNSKGNDKELRGTWNTF